MQKAKFILSKSKVLAQYDKVKQFADFISYSSKTNPLVTAILEEKTDCFFSIHMLGELRNVHDKSRVLFLAQAWSLEDIRFLTDQGVRSFVVDNESDLDLLLSFLEEHDSSITLFLRLKLKERTLRTERYFVFGMPSDAINKRIRALSCHPRIEQFGVHFHRKTQNMSEWNYVYEISNVLDEDVLASIDIINIGGGLPSEYANTNVDVIQSVFMKIQEFREWLHSKNIRLMLEPGRFISASAAKLMTTIIGIHSHTIIVNASVYNSDMDALIVPVKLLVEGELAKGEGNAYDIKGITPCSMDMFRYRVYLNNPKVGDDLVFLNAGAYNFSTDFCDLEKLETEIVD